MKTIKDNIKSGKEILDAFFNDIKDLSVDKEIASIFNSLYKQGKFTDTNIKNELQKLRESSKTDEN
jgi:hypothetical protein